MRVCTICGSHYESGTYGRHKNSHRPEQYGIGKPDRARRDVRLLLAGIRTGMSGADVARMEGISRERVRQLWVKATGAPLPVLGTRPRPNQETRRVRRFWANVRPDESGCWLWVASCYPSGYGHVSKGYAHRRAYEYVKGPIPKGLTIAHLCRVRACVNPEHLTAKVAA